MIRYEEVGLRRKERKIEIKSSYFGLYNIY